MAQCIWHGEWDKDLSKEVVGMSIFLLKLNQLIHEDVKKRPLLASVLEIFVSDFHNIELPDSCFRYVI
jgi:hypothetical protein